MPRSRWIGRLLSAVGIVLLVIALVVGVHSTRSWLPASKVKLPNGGVITLEGVTWGKVHRFDPRSIWQKVAGSKRAADYADTLRTFDEDTLVFWCRVPMGTRGKKVTLADDRGNEVGSGQPMGRITGPQSFPFSHFPRRSSRLKLRLWGGRQHWAGKVDLLLAELPVDNPARSDPAAWQPEPLPVRRTFEGADLTLSDVAAQVMRESRAPVFKSAATTAVVRVRRLGDQPHDWVPASAALVDATGNVVEARGSWDQQSGEIRCQFAAVPIVDETACRIRLEMARTAGFAPRDLWTVPNVPVKLGTRADWGSPVAETTVNGLRLRCWGVRGGSMSAGNAMTRVDMPGGVDPDLSVGLVSIRDEQGRTATLRSAFTPHHLEFLTAPTLTIPMSCNTTPRTLDLTFAVQPRRFVEFTFAPPRPTVRTLGDGLH
jgi:hypothetical protein